MKACISMRSPEETGVDPLRAKLSTSKRMTACMMLGLIPAASLLAAGLPNQGPDLVVGDLLGLQQFGRVGDVVGLAVGTTSCNKGDVEVHWNALPSNDHPLIPQNLYRLRGGRLEQIGQSWMKHGFFALQMDACGYGCTPAADGTRLGVGCSDPYDAGLNASTTGLSSKAWVNPFTGAYSAADSASHAFHQHTAVSHRIQVRDADLDPNLNGNSTAQYFVEAQYVTPHEYILNNGIANTMFNNVSYRRFTVTGSSGGTYTFHTNGTTIRELPALYAWSSYKTFIEPASGSDGRAILAYYVSPRAGGLWHYEYAIYNMNLDRAIGSLSIPAPPSAAISSVGFHAPPQHEGYPGDGTAGGLGFSAQPWTVHRSADTQQWFTDSMNDNPNANAVRWGTMYNFWFDSTTPPRQGQVSLGMFKTGDAVLANALIPDGDCNANGVGDSVDISSATSLDVNLNGIPDECEVKNCTGDVTGNGTVNVQDLFAVINAWGASGANAADVTGDSVVDVEDLLAVISHWGTCT